MIMRLPLNFYDICLDNGSNLAVTVSYRQIIAHAYFIEATRALCNEMRLTAWIDTVAVQYRARGITMAVYSGLPVTS